MNISASDKAKLGALCEALEEAVKILESAHDEAEAEFDELSERQQEGDKGFALQDSMNTLNEASGDCEQARSALEELLA